VYKSVIYHVPTWRISFNEYPSSSNAKFHLNQLLPRQQFIPELNEKESFMIFVRFHLIKARFLSSVRP